MAPNATNSIEDPGGSVWYDSFGYPQGPLNNAVLMEWIDQGLDFFGCDENAPKKVFGESLKLQSSPSKPIDLASIDYAKLHDEFLEACLYEQIQKRSSSIKRDSSESGHSGSVSGSSTQYTSSASSEPSIQPNTARNKRPRPLRLHRRVMPALSNNNPINNHHENKKQKFHADKGRTKSPLRGKSCDDSVPVVFSDISRCHFPPPIVYLHPLCRMQKDKGKGEPIASNICAKGRDACMDKMRQKMELLTKVAFGDDRKGSSDMKRRPAKVAEVFPTFTETRSIIELRMGFLSMQYGVLLRWDTTRSGRATLVVLRKMCHEQFYVRNFKNTKKPNNKFFQPSAESPPYAIRNVINGTHAVLQRPDGMEVALLDPPYRVSRPEVFLPSVLSVSVLYATGLARKSNWTVQLMYDGKTENLLLAWDEEQGCLIPKLGVTLKREIPRNASMELSTLDIRLFEHKIRRRSKRRCVATMQVPLQGLEAHPNSSDAKPSQMKVPCTHDKDSILTLALLLQSDYINWLRSELEARRREEVNNFVWKAPFRLTDVSPRRTVKFRTSNSSPVKEEEPEDDGLWEWLCNAC